MTSDPGASGGASANTSRYADRCYRSPAGMVGGVVLLALGLWLTGDTVLRGAGRAPWLAVSALLLFAPLVAAFTLRPAVFAGARRLRVRNPFRTVTIPWGAAESVRAGYTSEVVAGGKTYQLWAVPVSLRQRNKAARHNDRVTTGQPPPRGGFLGLGGAPQVGEPDTGPRRSHADTVIDEIRELAAHHGESSTGTVHVRWAWEIIGAASLGALALAVLLAV